MTRAIFIAAAVLGCGSREPQAPPDDRAAAERAAKDCTDTVESLAPDYQRIGPELAHALQMDKDEARRLIRDSIELLISTRELLCNVSSAAIDTIAGKWPDDATIIAARARVWAGLARLVKVRDAYDDLLGAATAAPSDKVVDEAALVDRFSNALLGR